MGEGLKLMISANNLTKKFEKIKAVDNVTCDIKSGCVYGLVGTNGSGKSTFLRLLAGVYYPDKGSIKIDGNDIFDNSEVKANTFFLPDTPYFFHQSSINKMAKFYKHIYKNFDEELYKKLLSIFPVNPAKTISSMSKGMQRQAAIVLAFSCRPKLIILDEAFDGLDPLIRKSLKSIICDAITESEITVVIASHNLRELEDLCDYIGLMHQGNFLLNNNLDDLKETIHNVQIVSDINPDELKNIGLDLLEVKKNQGNLQNWIIRGGRDEILEKLNKYSPKYLEIVSPTLEDIFIWTTEVIGYDVSKIIV